MYSNLQYKFKWNYGNTLFMMKTIYWGHISHDTVHKVNHKSNRKSRNQNIGFKLLFWVLELSGSCVDDGLTMGMRTKRSLLRLQVGRWISCYKMMGKWCWEPQPISHISASKYVKEDMLPSKTVIHPAIILNR